MLSREEVDRRLESNAKLLADPSVFIGERAVLKWEREALETAQKLASLLADLRFHCIDCEVDCNGPNGYEERVCPMAIAEREADAWIGGEGK